MMLVYPVGTPLAFFILLNRKKHIIMHRLKPLVVLRSREVEEETKGKDRPHSSQHRDASRTHLRVEAKWSLPVPPTTMRRINALTDHEVIEWTSKVYPCFNGVINAHVQVCQVCVQMPEVEGHGVGGLGGVNGQ